MIILHNAYYNIDSIFADKEFEAERHTASYVYGYWIKATITKWIYKNGLRESFIAKMELADKVVLKSSDEEMFFSTLETMGFQIGDHEGERVTLTELGEQEVALLSSIPYLFTKDTKRVER